MINVIKHGLNKIKGKTNRTWEQQKYRNDLAKLLIESRKMGDAWRISAKNELKKVEWTFEYLMAKYWTDKQWALNLINYAKKNSNNWDYFDRENFLKWFFNNLSKFSWLDKEVAIAYITSLPIDEFFRHINEFSWLDKEVAMTLITFHDGSGRFVEEFSKHIDNFSWLDEEVAIMFLEKNMEYVKYYNSYSKIFWRNIGKFSVGNKFIIYFLDKFDGDKKYILSSLINKWCYKGINYDDKFINYLLKEHILVEWEKESMKMLRHLKKHILNKKDVFDEKDACYINECVRLWLREIGWWLNKDNIMKFPDKSLDYSVFKLTESTKVCSGYKWMSLTSYTTTWVNSDSFRKFKTYKKHYVCTGGVTWYYKYAYTYTPTGEYDSCFDRLYEEVYERPEIEKQKRITRENNLYDMKKMTFGDLLALYLSKEDRWKEEVSWTEILEIMLSKKVESWEVRKAQVDKLFNKINEATRKRFVKKLKGVDLI